MTRVQGLCKYCHPPGRLLKTYDHSLRVRFIQLVLPRQRVRCDSCGREGWAWSFGWTDLRNGELPPGVLLLFSVVALLIALFIAK